MNSEMAWMFNPAAFERAYPPDFVWSPPPEGDIYKEMRDARDPRKNPDVSRTRPMEPRARMTREELEALPRGPDIYAAIRACQADASVTKPLLRASSTGGSTVSGFICP